MYIGLTQMNKQELSEIARLIGVETPPSSKDVLLDIVSGWIARAVKKEGCAQDEVERCVLEWTAESWKIIVPSGTDTDDLERSLRLRIAQDAAEFLSPGWAICCALIAVGQASNITDKLDLMEAAVSTAVPSQRARRAKRQEWDALCRRWCKNDPSEELEPYLAAIGDRAGLQAECLSLGLALSLLDGKISFPTERLYRDICDRLEMGRGTSDEIREKINVLYWKHHNAAVPTQTKAGEPDDPVRSATQKTVYDAGALEALATEARQQLFASFEPEDKKKSGWSKLVGGLSGMPSFFSNKMKNSTHATLARVVYHTILKQHDTVVAAARVAHSGLERMITEEAAPPQAPVAAQAPSSQFRTATPSEGLAMEPSGLQAAIPRDQGAAGGQSHHPSPAQQEAPRQVDVAATTSEQQGGGQPESVVKPPAALADQMVDVAKAPKRIIKLDL